MEEHELYMKTDSNIFINKKYIKWIKEINNCLEIYTKSNCSYSNDTDKICKNNNLEDYNNIFTNIINKEP